jgi:hypothetical protein
MLQTTIWGVPDVGTKVWELKMVMCAEKYHGWCQKKAILALGFPNKVWGTYVPALIENTL